MTTRFAPRSVWPPCPGQPKSYARTSRKRFERRGFSRPFYCPSFGDGLGLCEAIAPVRRVRFASVPAFTNHPI